MFHNHSPELMSAITSFNGEDSQKILPVLVRFAHIADRLAEAMVTSESFQRSTIAYEICDIILELSGAEVASCRSIETGEEVGLIARKWGNNVEPFGEVPKRKHREDCQTRIRRVTGGRRTSDQLDTAMNRKNSDGSSSSYYSDEKERQHFRELGSEAIIPLMVGTGVPKALLVLGHRDADYFDEKRIIQLESLRGFFNGFYQLSDLAEDRYEKQVLLQKIAQVIPLILEAPTKLAFHRSICALLTCEYGFKFGRAIYFSTNDGQLPAMCEMAIGGIGDDWPDHWSTGISPAFNDLKDYIEDAFEFPIPGDNPLCVPDSLYSAACVGGPATLISGESPDLEAFLKSGKDSKGRSVLCLSHNDPWITSLHRERDEMFFNNNDQFFVFALRPLGADSENNLMGFVIADLPYQAQKHQPGLGFPDLGMSDFVLKLLTALWYFREDAKSYFHVLSAVSYLRHSGDYVIEAIEDFVEDLGGAQGLPANSIQNYSYLVEHGMNISKAKYLFEKSRDLHAEFESEDLFTTISKIGRRSMDRHKDKIVLQINPLLKDVHARISSDDLASILECLFDNAVIHGLGSKASLVHEKRTFSQKIFQFIPRHSINDTVKVSVSLRTDTIQIKGKGERSRMVLKIENNGMAISKNDIVYLFSDGVTSNTIRGHGTGLSSARQIARAYGGDVVLLENSPVVFGVVLTPRKVASSGSNSNRQR